MEQVINKILQVLIKLGSAGLMVGIFIDGFGIPFPGGLMIIISGILIQQGKLNLFKVLLAIIVGHLAGSSAAYFIGKYVGAPFIEKYGRYIKITPQRLDKGQQLLKESAAFYIIFGRFVPTVGNITPYIAGVSKLKYLSFLAYSSIFAFLWGVLNTSIGYIFGHSWRQASNYLTTKVWLVIPLVVLLYLASKYYNIRKKLRE